MNSNLHKARSGEAIYGPLLEGPFCGTIKYAKKNLLCNICKKIYISGYVFRHRYTRTVCNAAKKFYFPVPQCIHNIKRMKKRKTRALQMID